MSHSKPKILIAEDEASIREGLVDVLNFHDYETQAVENGQEALEKFKVGTYHLIILDVMMPELNGYEVCDAIRKLDRNQAIIMLTAKGEEEDIIQGLKLGADDYITKPFSIRQLLARIEAVIRRSSKTLVDQKKMNWGPFNIDPLNLNIQKNEGPFIELTRREVDLLIYLIHHAERPVSRQELLKEVWGYQNPDIDTRTVDIHMTKLRKKIEVNPEKPEFILTIRGEGYRIAIAKSL